MKHHAIPRGTALCGATLRPPEVKSCRIIWCVVQREHRPIVENRRDFLGVFCFQRLLSMQFIQNKSFWTFYCAFYKDILHFLNPKKAPKNKINWTKWRIFFGTPKYGLCHHIFSLSSVSSNYAWIQQFRVMQVECNHDKIHVVLEIQFHPLSSISPFSHF